jgi:predicted unusual protein kinase regulating ubiquinone biosynthesis (AarF/ABC1/UbiB family)
MVRKAKLDATQQARFDKAQHAWVEVVIFDVMRTCLVMNIHRTESIFLHQDLHSNNVAVTSKFRGALADFGRSIFIQKKTPLEFVKELQRAAFQNGALREEMNTLTIYGDLTK